MRSGRQSNIFMSRPLPLLCIVELVAGFAISFRCDGWLDFHVKTSVHDFVVMLCVLHPHLEGLERLLKPSCFNRG